MSEWVEFVDECAYLSVRDGQAYGEVGVRPGTPLAGGGVDVWGGRYGPYEGSLAEVVEQVHTALWRVPGVTRACGSALAYLSRGAEQ